MTTDLHGNAWRWGTSPLDSISVQPGPMLTFAVERNHPLVRIWTPLRDDIERALAQSPVQWCAIEAFGRRRTIERADEDDHTTVIVTGRKQDEQDWMALEQMVRGKCAAHGL